MAAGTAAALVPIRSITRDSRTETSTYLAADSDEPGPVFVKLLSTLQGVQLGKIKDTFGWNSEVKQVDVKNYAPGENTNGVSADNVDRLP
jgi:branched-chain amino acid aminotransferase